MFEGILLASLLQPANEVCEGYVLYTCLSVILFGEGCLGPGPRGRLGVWPGGCLGPVPGEVWGSGQRESPGQHLGGCPGPYQGEVSRPRPRGVGSRPRPRPIRVVSQHALTQTPLPPQQMATAAGGTHPTGMHSCFQFRPASKTLNGPYTLSITLAMGKYPRP